MSDPRGSEGGGAHTESYTRHAELAEAQLALAEAGRREELASLQQRAEALIAALPAQAPAAARPALERAARAQEQLARRLDADLAAAGADLDRARLARRAARSYAASAGASSGTRRARRTLS